MIKYRSRTDIASQMLEAANGGTTKTKIMYKAFLSYSQLREYLSMLTDNGLLEYDKSTETFKTTEKGTRFLRICNEMAEFVTTTEQQTTTTAAEVKGMQ